MDENVDGFLIELSALTLKYGIKIHGCGCYDALQTLDGEGLSHSLKFNNNEYEVDPL